MQSGGMRRFIKVCDLFVHSVDCERILDQIVGSDAEEIDHGCEDIGADGCAWDFNHRANLDLFVQRNARPDQLLMPARESGLGTADSSQPEVHGKKDVKVPDSTAERTTHQCG